jgi:hypothetical protein
MFATDCSRSYAQGRLRQHEALLRRDGSNEPPYASSGLVTSRSTLAPRAAASSETG